MIPLMGSPYLSKWVRTRCRKRIDGIRVSVLGFTYIPTLIHTPGSWTQQHDKIPLLVL